MSSSTSAMSRRPRQQFALALIEMTGVSMSLQYFSRGKKPGRLVARLHDQIDFALPQIARVAHQLGIVRNKIVIGQSFELERAVVKLDVLAAILEDRRNRIGRRLFHAPISSSDRIVSPDSWAYFRAY